MGTAMTDVLHEARRRLLERRHKLLRLSEQEVKGAEEAAQAHVEPDALDRAAGHEVEVVAATLIEGERRELREIDAALRRIEQGTYGRCASCGQALGRQRLRALPEARLCLDCSAGES